MLRGRVGGIRTCRKLPHQPRRLMWHGKGLWPSAETPSRVAFCTEPAQAGAANSSAPRHAPPKEISSPRRASPRPGALGCSPKLTPTRNIIFLRKIPFRYYPDLAGIRGQKSTLIAQLRGQLALKMTRIPKTMIPTMDAKRRAKLGRAQCVGV
jgi:hypothetical protein